MIESANSILQTFDDLCLKNGTIEFVATSEEIEEAFKCYCEKRGVAAPTFTRTAPVGSELPTIFFACSKISS